MRSITNVLIQDGSDQAAAAAEAAAGRVEAAQARAQAAMDRAQAAHDRALGIEEGIRARAEAGIGVPPPYVFADRSARRHEALMFCVFLVVAIAVTTVLLPIARAIASRLTGRARRDELASPGSAERLERIEAAVEAMAIEVERISEGQRFTTRLLSDRAASGAPMLPLDR